jgi:hypothetical protein
MQNVENTPRREDDDTTTQQQGNSNSSQQDQQSNSNQGQQGQQNRKQDQQGGSQKTGEQADQSSTYRGQEGQEYDVDASDAVNRQADYSGNSQRDIEDAKLNTDRDMESQHDSDQDINPGDTATNKDFNR